jgi:sigma-B regulation protein RsbU (phosphoserine phosphatase)
MMVLSEKAMSACSEGITIADASRPNNPLIYVNEGFLRLSGYTREEVIGSNCRFLQGPKTDLNALAEIRDAIREERPCSVELLNYRKDGSVFWNQLSITPIHDAAGKTAYFIGIQSDTTERVSAENQLRDTLQQLKGANDVLFRDLKAAATIQQSLLPDPKTVLHGVTTAWRFEPCESLAGDLLNVIPVQNRYLVFYILDVTGHGTPSALLSVAVSRLLLPTLSSSSLLWAREEGRDNFRLAAPATVVDELNKAFPWEPAIGQFFTIVYGVFDAQTGEVRFVTAGHPGMIQIPQEGEPVIHRTNGLPIGVGDVPYEEGRFLLQDGDRLLALSDGVTESMSPKMEVFSEARLKGTIQEVKSLPLEEMLDSILTRLSTWRDGESCHDDVSLVALSRYSVEE